tara:strand:- start:111 stop:416 length:306 start_codon:yes stop_codon:yes gene_type:complete
MRTPISLLVALFLYLLLGAVANAQSICSDHKQVTQKLLESHQEAPVNMGIAANGGVVEVFASPSGSSWTITITMPNNLTCMLATGEGWESFPHPVQGGDKI